MTDRLFSLQQLDPEPKASPRPAAERATIGEDGIYEVEAIVDQIAANAMLPRSREKVDTSAILNNNTAAHNSNMKWQREVVKTLILLQILPNLGERAI